MKKPLIPAGATLVLALVIAGCETDGGVAARTQEKSALYATLRPWQKRLIERGTISQSFTPDMVYLAMGRPDKIETKELAEGHAELWTYTHFFPNVDAVHGFRHADFTTESAYQPQRPLTVKNDNGFQGTGNQPTAPVGQGTVQSIFLTGGPQGGNMEPADLRSYTIKVLFASGKAVQIGADENVH